MNMDRKARGRDAKSLTNASDDPASGSGPRLIVPSADILAIVRHAEPPSTAPHPLAPYVVRVGVDPVDWVLTDDVVAFATGDVTQGFAEWRSTWERVWTLDSALSIGRLLALARELDLGTRLEAVLNRHLTDDEDVVLPPDAQPVVMEQLTRLAETIRERDAHGFGIVDRTPDTERVGLARAWPACGESEIVAADQHTEVRFQPDIGLVVATGTGPDRVVIAAVDDVRLDGNTYIVSGSGLTISLDPGHGRPLSWLMPGSTEWRVRRIPEIVAWARTFGGLEEAHRYASGLRLPLRLTRHRPIMPAPGPTTT